MRIKGMALWCCIVLVSVALVGCGRESKKSSAAEAEAAEERAAQRAREERERAQTEAKAAELKQKVVGTWVAHQGISRTVVEVGADGRMKLTTTMMNIVDVKEPPIVNRAEGPWETDATGLILHLERSMDGREIPEEMREIKLFINQKTAADGTPFDVLVGTRGPEFVPESQAPKAPAWATRGEAGGAATPAPTPVRQRPGARGSGAGNEAGRSEARRATPPVGPAIATKDIAGELEWAFKAVLENASAIEDTRDFRQNMLAEAGELRAKLGDIAGAKAICAQAKGERRDRLGGRIVAMVKATGDAAAVQATAKELGLSPRDRNVCVGFAMAQAEAGDAAGARSTIAVLDDFPQAEGYLDLVQVTRSKEDLDLAMGILLGERGRLTKRTPETQLRVGSIYGARMAEAKALVGDVAGARTAIANITGTASESYREEARWRVARAQARTGTWLARR